MCCFIQYIVLYASFCAPYITQELKEYEEKILGAEDKILVLETQLYAELVQSLSEFIPAIQTDANQIARLDCLLSLPPQPAKTIISVP